MIIEEDHAHAPSAVIAAEEMIVEEDPKSYGTHAEAEFPTQQAKTATDETEAESSSGVRKQKKVKKLARHVRSLHWSANLD